MTNPRELYERRCRELDVKPNSALVDMLPTTDEELTELDLSNNMVGLKGLVPVLDVVKDCRKITTFSVADNQLTSPAAKEVGAKLMGHPTLTALDISKNHLPLGGEAMLELAKANQVLRKIDITDTHIRPLFTKLIEYQLKKNEKGSDKITPLVITAEEKKEMENDEYDFGNFCFGGDVTVQDEEPKDEDIDDDEKDDNESDMDEEEEARQAAMLRAMQAGGARRKTVSSEVISKKDMTDFQAKVVLKEEADTKWLLNTLEDVHLFSHLEDYELKQAVDAMEVVKLEKGELAIEEGEEGSRFIIIKQGTAEESKAGNIIRTLNPNDTMGETDLLYSAPHPCSVSVTSDVLTGFCLDRNTYRHIVTKSSADKRQRYMGFLEKISFLKTMQTAELMQLADALKSTQYKAGEIIIEHGSPGMWFHIITEGVVEVIGRKEGEKVKVCTFTEGECVGELEFINNHMCVADVIATEPGVRTAKMNRRHFEKVMGPCVDLLKRTADTSDVFQYYRETRKEEQMKDS
eukprot:TRINITY_DN22455_c0_g1_i2.p1 TRINITY_DN22455_c0_g1~~TRINITY_DN22455_c0_g1_i2.p1  ORF type:complete len:519 (+),score=170.21 TRINITY_DN22455_c0_g1_i2:143-1699(+)